MRIRQHIDSQLSAFDAYVGVRPSSLAIFGLLLAGTAIVATAIYWGVFGRQHWNNEMVVAQRILTAAAVSPLQPQQPGQYLCPTHGAVGLPRYNAAGGPVCPICGSPMQFRPINTAGATPAAFAGG